MVYSLVTTSDPDPDHLAAALNQALLPLVGDASPPGLAWGLDLHGIRHLGALGHLDTDGRDPVRTNSIFRISSMTKPVTAAAALSLVEDGLLSLDEPIDRLIPELAGPSVLRRPAGPLTHTETARRPITLEDLLTFRLGHGADFATMGDQTPLDARLNELGLALGPPDPRAHPDPDDWLARLGSVPLRHQPGHRWLYNTGAEVLGVLLARACGTSLTEVLRGRVFDPLEMQDTGFWVPPESRTRLGSCFASGEQQPEPAVFDPPDGGWSSPPAFEGGDGGLVSTTGDYLAFAVLLRDSGASGDSRILTQDTVRAMTTNQLSDEQLRAGGPSPDGSTGWGYGVGVSLGDPSPTVVGSYGWDGGLGSTWRNDTARGLSAVLLTNQMWDSPEPPAIAEAFWSVLAELVPLPG